MSAAAAAAAAERRHDYPELTDDVCSYITRSANSLPAVFMPQTSVCVLLMNVFFCFRWTSSSVCSSSHQPPLPDTPLPVSSYLSHLKRLWRLFHWKGAQRYFYSAETQTIVSVSTNSVTVTNSDVSGDGGMFSPASQRSRGSWVISGSLVWLCAAKLCKCTTLVSALNL